MNRNPTLPVTNTEENNNGNKELLHTLEMFRVHMINMNDNILTLRNVIKNIGGKGLVGKDYDPDETPTLNNEKSNKDILDIKNNVKSLFDSNRLQKSILMDTYEFISDKFETTIDIFSTIKNISKGIYDKIINPSVQYDNLNTIPNTMNEVLNATTNGFEELYDPLDDILDEMEEMNDRNKKKDRFNEEMIREQKRLSSKSRYDTRSTFFETMMEKYFPEMEKLTESIENLNRVPLHDKLLGILFAPSIISDVVAGPISAFVSSFTTSFKTGFIESYRPLFNVIKLFANTTKNVAKGIYNLIKFMGNMILDDFIGVISRISRVFPTTSERIVRFISGIERISIGLGSVVSRIVSNISNIFQSIKNSISNLYNTTTSWYNVISNTITRTIDLLKNNTITRWFISEMSRISSRIMSIINVPRMILDEIRTYSFRIFNFTESLANTFKRIGSLLGRIGSVVAKIFGPITGLFLGFGRQIFEIHRLWKEGELTFTTFLSTFKTMGKTWLEWIIGLPKMLIYHFDDMVRWVLNKGVDLINLIFRTSIEQFTFDFDVKGVIDSFFTSIVDFFNTTLPEWLNGLLGDYWATFVGSIIGGGISDFLDLFGIDTSKTKPKKSIENKEPVERNITPKSVTQTIIEKENVPEIDYAGLSEAITENERLAKLNTKSTEIELEKKLLTLQLEKETLTKYINSSNIVNNNNTILSSSPASPWYNESTFNRIMQRER